MKICFLDIDGVLNSCGSIIALGDSTHVDDFPRNFDQVSVKLLERLCKSADLKIYVHSTWSNYRDHNWFKKEIGIDVEFLEQLKYEPKRDDRIRSAVKHYNPEYYIIIDDDERLKSTYPDRLIQTDAVYGFNYMGYAKALTHFGLRAEIVLL